MIQIKRLAYILSLLLLAGCPEADLKYNAEDSLQSVKAPLTGYSDERERMVESQIAARGIRKKNILDAFLTVERHLFVPPKLRDRAYGDHPLPIGEGQTISQPYIVAFMTHVLNLSRSDRVLEIGTGSGYQAAILGELSDNVYSIEINEVLGLRAQGLLKELGYTNVNVKVGDGYKGWKEHAPFDAIIVTCAPSHVPVPLKEQLKEGGRMIIPVGESYDQKLVYIEKRNNELIQRSELPVLFVPMVDPSGKAY